MFQALKNKELMWTACFLFHLFIQVRKKSAKVLEMEEFEQVEKTQHVTKKGRIPKPGGKLFPEEQDITVSDKTQPLSKKMKAFTSPAVSNLLSALDGTPVSSKVGKVGAGKSEFGANLTKPVQQFVPVQTSGILTTGVCVFCFCSCGDN